MEQTTHEEKLQCEGDKEVMSPQDQAVDNIAYVATKRLMDKLDAEQAEQALEALNGSRKEN